MNNLPNDLKYSQSHEWAKAEDDGTLLIGITHHAQELLGDMVYVELPEVGRKLAADEECAVVESVKAASDVYCPVAGEIVEVNSALSDQPELINQDPYGKGWMFRMRPDDPDSLGELLDAAAYEELIESESA